jgi:hypothetical protein
MFREDLPFFFPNLEQCSNTHTLLVIVLGVDFFLKAEMQVKIVARVLKFHQNPLIKI